MPTPKIEIMVEFNDYENLEREMMTCSSYDINECLRKSIYYNSKECFNILLNECKSIDIITYAFHRSINRYNYGPNARNYYYIKAIIDKVENDNKINEFNTWSTVEYVYDYIEDEQLNTLFWYLFEKKNKETTLIRAENYKFANFLLKYNFEHNFTLVNQEWITSIIRPLLNHECIDELNFILSKGFNIKYDGLNHHSYKVCYRSEKMLNYLIEKDQIVSTDFLLDITKLDSYYYSRTNNLNNILLKNHEKLKANNMLKSTVFDNYEFFKQYYINHESVLYFYDIALNIGLINKYTPIPQQFYTGIFNKNLKMAKALYELIKKYGFWESEDPLDKAVVQDPIKYVSRFNYQKK